MQQVLIHRHNQCSIRREQYKPVKGSVLQDDDKTEKRKTNTTEEWKWEDKENPMAKKDRTLEAEVLVDLDHGQHPLTYFKRLQE